MKSFVLKKQDLISIQPTAIHIDITNEHKLGRVASQIALFLRGKHKPSYTPNLLCGDKVVVTNVSKLQCTTKYKSYFKHTGYAGGIKEITYDDALKKDACFPLLMAIKRMLNKSKLRKLMLRNLYLFESESENINGFQLKKISV